MAVNSQRGNVLVFAVMAMSGLIVLAATFLYLAYQAKSESTLYQREMQAYYTAEAGIALALNMLKKDPNWQGIENAIPFAGGVIKQLDVKARDTGGTITSVAEHQGVIKTLIADYQTTIANRLHFDKGMYIYGTGENFKIGATAVINSDLYLAEDDAEIKEHVEISGKIFPNMGSNITLTLDDLQEYKNLPGVQVISGSESITLDNLSGTYFVNGSVEIEGDYSNHITIIATGDITCNGSIGQNNKQAVLCLISGNNIILGKEDNLYEQRVALLAFALNELVVTNMATITGAIVAASIDIKNQFTFTYEQTMVDLLPRFLYKVQEKYPVY